MKLTQYLIEATSSDTAIRQLISLAANLASHTRQNKDIFIDAKSKAEYNEVEVLKDARGRKKREVNPVNRGKSQVALRNNRWFNENFKSSKRTSTGLQSALQSLSHSSLPSEIKEQAKKNANMPTTAYNAQGREASGSNIQSNSKNYDNLLITLPAFMINLSKVIKDDDIVLALQQKAHAITNALDVYKSTISSAMSDTEDDIKTNKKSKSEEQVRTGQLNTQANNLASQMINQLVPKNKRAAIRKAVDQSDNKLYTLKIELEKLGIHESISFKNFLLYS